MSDEQLDAIQRFAVGFCQDRTATGLLLELVAVVCQQEGEIRRLLAAVEQTAPTDYPTRLLVHRAKKLRAQGVTP